MRKARQANNAIRIVRRWPASSVVTDEFAFRHLEVGDRAWFMQSIDDEVRDWQGYDDHTVESFGRVFSSLARRPHAVLPARWLVVANAGGPIGTYVLSPCLGRDFDVEIGWWLAAPARGRGLGRASLQALLAHVHLDLDLEVAQMGTTIDNVRAIRQIEAAGAELVDERDHALPNGRVVAGRWYRHVVD